MRLHDALKVNGKARLPNWCGEYYLYVDYPQSDCIYHYVGKAAQQEYKVMYPDLIRDDWEPYVRLKEKKIIVIENVRWYKESTIYPATGYNWRSLLGKPPMKMTLEWEE